MSEAMVGKLCRSTVVVAIMGLLSASTQSYCQRAPRLARPVSHPIMRLLSASTQDIHVRYNNLPFTTLKFSR